MILLGKDYFSLPVTAGNMLIDEEEMTLLSADAYRNVHMLMFAPNSKMICSVSICP